MGIPDFGLGGEAFNVVLIALFSPIAVDQLVTWVRGEATLFELVQ
jgi:hypothetical protein